MACKGSNKPSLVANMYRFRKFIMIIMPYRITYYV